MSKNYIRFFSVTVLILMFTVVATGCSFFEKQSTAKEEKGSAAQAEHKSNQTHVIGIIGAMEEEVKNIHRKMKVDQTKKQSGLTFYKGIWENQEIVLVRSGVGKVNAAMTAQILIDKFGVDALINTGIAGGPKQKLNIGDIVISTQTVQHDMNAADKEGEVPRMDKTFFKADPELVKLAKESAGELPKNIDVYTGTIATGDQFVTNDEKSQRIANTFDAWAIEMEGSAIGQIAYLNDIPYVVIRSISDTAGDEGGELYHDFKDMAAQNAIDMVRHILKSYSNDDDAK
ncbi:5'-methylthioadenosine/S-adenosylhomocysteine nucleosidase [Lentibacillus kapialis]|uniref:adenosylhomocysteine nucleosidase n=1 Tax=Lentibacillus kapialis TaxID=340214 RepID=A0A917V0M4_9BACI|nr:5'-methylthioadenosine/adenosylhomocysteine nucleosidase [Lentibacillus kapialis]GGK04474.1 5'-methylthioadenosine/S-adenosylhomocysteine nucleosidase [Lentibacillus kapialis]